MRLVRVIIGTVLVVVALPMLVAGGALWGAMQHRGSDGAFGARITPVSTSGYAIVAPDLDGLLRREASFARGGETTLSVAGTSGKRLFIGIAPVPDMQLYLAGHARAQLNRVRLARGTLPVDLRQLPGGTGTVPAPAAAPGTPPTSLVQPATLPFWQAASHRSGNRETLTWSPSSMRGQHVALVIMNADGAPDVNAALTATVNPGWLDPTTWGLLILGTVLFVLGSGALVWPRRYRDIVYVVEPSKLPEIAAKLGVEARGGGAAAAAVRAAHIRAGDPPAPWFARVGGGLPDASTMATSGRQQTFLSRAAADEAEAKAKADARAAAKARRKAAAGAPAVAAQPANTAGAAVTPDSTAGGVPGADSTAGGGVTPASTAGGAVTPDSTAERAAAWAAGDLPAPRVAEPAPETAEQPRTGDLIDAPRTAVPVAGSASGAPATAPATTAPVTTAPVTTVPVTTAPVTTAPAGTAADAIAPDADALSGVAGGPVARDTATPDAVSPDAATPDATDVHAVTPDAVAVGPVPDRVAPDADARPAAASREPAAEPAEPGAPVERGVESAELGAAEPTSLGSAAVASSGVDDAGDEPLTWPPLHLDRPTAVVGAATGTGWAAPDGPWAGGPQTAGFRVALDPASTDAGGTISPWFSRVVTSGIEAQPDGATAYPHADEAPPADGPASPADPAVLAG